MPCICTLLAFPGMTWAQEKMRQEAKEGKKPSLRSGAFCPTPLPRLVLPLSGGQKEMSWREQSLVASYKMPYVVPFSFSSINVDYLFVLS